MLPTLFFLFAEHQRLRQVEFIATRVGSEKVVFGAVPKRSQSFIAIQIYFVPEGKIT